MPASRFEAKQSNTEIMFNINLISMQEMYVPDCEVLVNAILSEKGFLTSPS